MPSSEPKARLLTLPSIREWLSAPDGPHRGAPPFSFTYGGQPFANVAASWEISADEPVVRDTNRTQRTLVYRDPATGLVARVVAVEYADFPAVEWTVYLRNDGSATTPIVEGVQALDVDVAPVGEGEVVLHHATGSPALATDYAPRQTRLRPRTELRLGGRGGRPSDTDLPYVNLASPDGGTIIAIGWPGQWAARITRETGPQIHLQAG